MDNDTFLIVSLLVLSTLALCAISVFCAGIVFIVTGSQAIAFTSGIVIYVAGGWKVHTLLKGAL